MAMDLDPNDPEVRLSRFLYVGKEYPDYQPGNWFVHNYYLAKNVPSIEELAENTEKQLLPVQIIIKAFETNLVPNPETLVFALAVCCRQMKSESLRHEAYAALNKICASPQHFILFIKFASQISKQKELDAAGGSKHGWGQGLRKAANNWYLSKTPIELAECVTRYKGRYGWKHKDIVKLSHPVATDPGLEIILKYVVHGLKEAKEKGTSNEDRSVAEVLEYIERVEDFKRCTDEVRAAGLLETYGLTLDHVPGHLLKSKEVWNALIPSMNLVLLLTNLQRIHNLELLRPNSPTVSKIVDQFTSTESIAQDKVHPALVLVTIRDYENSGKPLTYEKRKIKEQFEKPLPVPPKPNSKIIDALYKMLNLSFNNVQPTGLRYMVTINMNKVMLETHCWRSGNVNGAEAGCMIALALLRSEKHVTVATFKNVGIHTVNIDKTASFGQAMRRLQQMPVGNVNLSKPMAWAAHQNNKYDVFVNVVDQIFEKSDTSEEALQTYKTKLKLPNTKLINCAVCSSSTYRKEKTNKSILLINGFDASVPVVVQAFAKSLF
ncbi:60 kDa SS-A/Ro ribonucleoprotein-like [Ceratina calcarata]|uniref:60 kDa SS-A/Ro ribonucleoprotein-like n=1 Tax=Ceratina calcarata TaxID=156304 RepID=A0AAJ7IZ75_9HYME|nr:60 kDa SS-A/Ro ribonucleoprotein-like [Ceratina calcarata]XP_017880742.1 60 kDa SS-A/Ro ribonucleoprotein-like [Ceratina calcarata]XP_017880743.1 60 kDa SS-A/Ro ribonucleoprotein-like [Ceratina calcarata]XP_026669662.1 60 kDa SS-A/Ro ribonucleoprotein-like [Ceratina calcarata]